jgi:N-acetylglutamate synthase-like GNAT family acetyltransferase
MKVRLATINDIEDCVAVLRSLPQYFTATAHHDAREALKSPMTVAMLGESEGTVVAFVLAVIRYAHSAEITHAAVQAAQRNRGIGTTVLHSTIEALADRGICLVQAKTLDASSDYEPYKATRAFWEARGFVQIDCIDPLPGWDPGNPSAIYVKALRST